MVSVVASAAFIATGVVFIFAAWSKFRDPVPTRRALVAHAGWRQAKSIHVKALAGYELILGVACVVSLGFSPIAPIAAGVAAATLLGFVGVLTRSLVRGVVEPCGCFGDRQSLSTNAVIRTTLLAVTALAAFLLSPTAQLRLSWTALAVSSVALAGVALLSIVPETPRIGAAGQQLAARQRSARGHREMGNP